jgi:adenosine deaminase
LSLHDLIAKMPKVELHVHLEGSIRPATLLALARRNGVPLPADDVEGLRRFYQFTDFDHFIQVYLTIPRCLRTVEDFDLIAYEFGADMARQNIRYAEVTFTPYTSVQNTGLPFDDILAGLNAGRARAGTEFDVEMAWVLDIVRDCPETRMDVARWAVRAMDRGVIALGLGGTERGNPPEGFADAFALALEAGLHRVPHAGELAGPESVWGALRALHADRLGHGVRSIEDLELVRTLVARQVPLEICPTSNLCLGVYPTYEAHPIRRLYEAGALVTVNSDDPPMFDIDLLAEYRALVDYLGFDTADLECLVLNAVHASFLPEEERQKMALVFRSDFLRLIDQHRDEGGHVEPARAR